MTQVSPALQQPIGFPRLTIGCPVRQELEVIPLNDDPELLKEKAERYRRLLLGTNDERTKTAAAALLAELEAKARPHQLSDEAAQEWRPEDAKG